MRHLVAASELFSWELCERRSRRLSYCFLKVISCSYDEKMQYFLGKYCLLVFAMYHDLTIIFEKNSLCYHVGKMIRHVQYFGNLLVFWMKRHPGDFSTLFNNRLLFRKLFDFLNDFLRASDKLNV